MCPFYRKGMTGMKINMVVFLTTSQSNRSEIVMKTFDSMIRPMLGDIIADPGFDPRFHNGYEVVKVTLDYSANECYVSLSPLAIELEEICLNDYIEKLVAHDWRIIPKEEWNNREIRRV